MTVVQNPIQIHRYIGLSTDTKPTIAAPDGKSPPTIGSTFYEYDTGTMFITYDGTNWEPKKSRAPVGLSASGLKTADGQIKGSAGSVYWLSVSDTVAAVIQLNDSLNDSGTDIWGITIPADGYAHFIFDPPLEFGTGIYLDVPTGAPDVYVGYI